MYQSTNLSHTDALKILDVVKAALEKDKKGAAVAIVDAHGELIAFLRTDGCRLPSINIAINKAFTARAFDIATKDLATHSQSGGQFFGIHASNDGRIMIFAGGIPLKKDGKVVGAVGVSGGQAGLITGLLGIASGIARQLACLHAIDLVCDVGHRRLVRNRQNRQLAAQRS